MLFVTKKIGNRGGGYVITQRNKQVLCELLGAENVDTYEIKDKPKTISVLYDRCTKAYVGGLDKDCIHELMDKSTGMDVVWIDGSFLGTISKELRINGYKGRIITFFHNVEKFFCKRSLLQQVLYPFFNGPLVRSEINAINYSNHVVTLTSRDADYVHKVNSVVKITLMPSSMDDQFEDKGDYLKASVLEAKSPLKLLFVGSYFYANVSGITWFVNKVLPFVDATLTIVGANMERLPFENSEKLKIHGFVEDLGLFYRDADAVVAPIFEGSGMKTKTTEALMWGKFVFGTDEAFCGFRINEEVGICCNTANEFISSLNRIAYTGIRRFNFVSRELFLHEYSNEKAKDILRRILQDGGF